MHGMDRPAGGLPRLVVTEWEHRRFCDAVAYFARADGDRLVFRCTWGHEVARWRCAGDRADGNRCRIPVKDRGARCSHHAHPREL